MSTQYLFSAVSALWVGIITSLSPCPLGTNIAALAYISKHRGSHRLAIIFHGLLYALGRALSYTIIGFLLVKGILFAPSFSFFMQKYANQVLSPILVLAGMYMLGMLGQDFEGFSFFDMSRFKPKSGALPSLLMGVFFALAFCPISAALYFGFIIPLSASHSDPLIMPLLYGLGTALPVILLAVVVDFGLKKAFYVNTLAGRFEKYAKFVTGWVFVFVGIYLGIKYIFGII